ncbi:MAG: T9SS type A sorting domain-containing protein [candidate division WOR-3 bacterium]|nr:T9SS type A sorting domain-containing protein [candidate division WOR-3 bacterium]
MKKLFLFAVIVSSVWAIWDMRFHDGNQWRFPIHNRGVFGLLPGSRYDVGAGEWPIGTGRIYLFGAGAWLGGILLGGDTLVTVGYDPEFVNWINKSSKSEFVPGFLPNEVNYTNPEERIYLSTDSIFPLTPVSNQDGWYGCNDFDTLYHDTLSLRTPLGITVMQRTYVFDWAPLDDIVYFEYKVVNDTNVTLSEIYFGLAVDPDIGISTDDMYGLDLPRRMAFAWDDNFHEPGWPWVGYIGMKLISAQGCSLTASKRFSVEIDPARDPDRYLMMAGYDYRTRIRAPYDTIDLAAADKRFLVTTGQFTLNPGETLTVVWAMIGGENLDSLRVKADFAQNFYNRGFPSYPVTLFYPNGREYLSGIIPITWTATGSPEMLIDILLSPDLGKTWDSVAFALPNTGTYLWNTEEYPDGVRYILRITAQDTAGYGWDLSDSVFSINNPGNAPPEVEIFSPVDDSVTGDYIIRWFARDPEFRDSLNIDIYFRQENRPWEPVTINEPNDREFLWQSSRCPNGPSWIKISTHDEEYETNDSAICYLYNTISSGTPRLWEGITDLISLNFYIHRPELINGHEYELTFLRPSYIPYDPLPGYHYYYPVYRYEITDLATGNCVLDDYSLLNGYQFDSVFFSIRDFSPLVDGFSLETRSLGLIDPSHFIYDSILTLIYPQDSIMAWSSPNNSFGRWAFRGSILCLAWTNHPSGGLTLNVYDEDYNIYIPYKPFIDRVDSMVDYGDGWCFLDRPLSTSGQPSETLRMGVDRCIYLSGAYIFFRRRFGPVTIRPEIGDTWFVYPTNIHPPVDSNKFRFTPVAIKEFISPARSFLKVNPTIFAKSSTVSYTLNRHAKVTLEVYDALGRKINTLLNDFQSIGQYNITWSGKDQKGNKVSNGTYFYVLKIGDEVFTKKVVLIR